MNRLFSPILIGLVLLITAYPFAWMFLSSFKTNREIYQPGKMLPESFDPFAYKLLFSGELFDFTAVLVRSLLLARRAGDFCLPGYGSDWVCSGQGKIPGEIPSLLGGFIDYFISQTSHEPCFV